MFHFTMIMTPNKRIRTKSPAPAPSVRRNLAKEWAEKAEEERRQLVEAMRDIGYIRPLPQNEEEESAPRPASKELIEALSGIGGHRRP